MHIEWTNIAVSILLGVLTASYWRGTWTLLDIWLCSQPQDASLAKGNSFCLAVDAPASSEASNTRHESGLISTGLGVGLLMFAMFLFHGLHLWSGCKVSGVRTAAVRGTILYVVGASAVCFWRGVWYLTDHYVMRDNVTVLESGIEAPLTSYWLTAAVGTFAAFATGTGASLLAPPSILLRDGPSKLPPTILLSVWTAYNQTVLPANARIKRLSDIKYFVDTVFSFLLLPAFVVWFWRGMWLIMDAYFWGFSADDSHVRISLIHSTVVWIACLTYGSQPVTDMLQSGPVMSRLRSFVLSLGAVNFWRMVWYLWDEFTGLSTLSSLASHVLSVVGLLAMGCLSCILAPPGVVGVDFEPHTNSRANPLFSFFPLSRESLHFFGIARVWQAPPSNSSTVQLPGVSKSTRPDSQGSAPGSAEDMTVSQTLSASDRAQDESTALRIAGVPLGAGFDTQAQVNVDEDYVTSAQ